MSGSDNYILAVAIDTAYPAPDVLYAGFERYQRLQPIAWLALIAGVIGIVGYFVTLVILTAKAGIDPDLPGIQLSWFDYWKTELGVLVILALAMLGFVPLRILNGYFSWWHECHGCFAVTFGGYVCHHFRRLEFRSVSIHNIRDGKG